MIFSIFATVSCASLPKPNSLPVTLSAASGVKALAKRKLPPSTGFITPMRFIWSAADMASPLLNTSLLSVLVVASRAPCCKMYFSPLVVVSIRSKSMASTLSINSGLMGNANFTSPSGVVVA